MHKVQKILAHDCTMCILSTMNLAQKSESIRSARENLRDLHPFIGASQLEAIAEVLRGEEAEAMAEIVNELAARIEKMPKTYGTNGDKNPVAFLHYFGRGGDAWITERDMGDPSVPGDRTQWQAYGAIDLGHRETGYISIAELIRNGWEIDLYWHPVPVRECA